MNITLSLITAILLIFSIREWRLRKNSERQGYVRGEADATERCRENIDKITKELFRLQKELIEKGTSIDSDDPDVEFTNLREKDSGSE